MDHSNTGNHWRQMFENGRRDSSSAQQPARGSGSAAPFGYDDGYDPAQVAGPSQSQKPLSPEEVTDEVAMALALDSGEYRPWVLQRGRGRPAMMLHLRRYEPKSGLWQGWQLAYSHLIAADYFGSNLVSLDFGNRQFVIEGTGLDELMRHLQIGSVLMVQEYSGKLWPVYAEGAFVRSIGMLGA